ncbi:hypothetical protein Riv7116_4839 [Rivularia sp. PCC 7116]|uniref:helix-turn-helix domain-containing protein n=1 Tax=Rivularia sp. PCC 7116 TaxID=373994 RepID=UPI00029ED608|nr:helix-turn-helix domain-containing protein [Rivularia sp. PCC 7116]AFY57250.1 hypothetical protein Riv7116_4839 [Rivularia sp. PCC 7116]
MIGTKKAAELLGISDRRVRKLIAQGRVYGAFKIGGSWVIPTENGYPQIKTASRGPKPTWKKVKTPAKNVVYINRQLIGKKMDDGNFCPPIAVKCRNKNTYSRRVVIPGPCVLVYEFENPLNDCGATAWLETFSQPEIKDGCTFGEIMAKNPQPVQRKTKSRKASGKGFSKKTNKIPVTA